MVLKLNSSTITHKTDVGGVILDIKSPEEVKTAFNTIRSNLAKIGRENEMQGVTVQRQISDGVEVIVGVTEDRMLGHVVMFGLGGIYAELIKDTAIRLHPLTDVNARELINSVKMSQLLKGISRHATIRYEIAGRVAVTYFSDGGRQSANHGNGLKPGESPT